MAGIFGSSSKSKSKVSKTETDGVLDQLLSDDAQQIALQNLKLNKGSSLSVDFTSAEALAAANQALSTAGFLSSRASDTSAESLLRHADLAAVNLETVAGLISDTGDVLAAGFDSALDFAESTRNESNLIAQSLTGGTAIAPIETNLRREPAQFDVARVGKLALVGLAIGFAARKFL